MGKYAILIVFALTFGLITYSHGLRNNHLSSQRQAVEGFSLTQAQNIAQSTAMIVVNRIRQNDSNYIPGGDQTFYFPSGGDDYESWGDMSGEYRLEVHNSGDSLLTIQSEGQLNETNYLVTVLLNRSDPIWSPNLQHAVFAGSSINMSGSARIIGDVGTNAVTANAVTFSGNPRITGGLAVGPGGDPYEVLDAPDWQGTNSWVEGGVSSSSELFEFELPPFIDFPPQTNPAPPISLSGANNTTIQGSSISNMYIPEIRIQGNNTLTIDTGGQDIQLHVGNLNIQQGHLNFTGGGHVTLMVEDDMTVSGSSSLNAPGETGDLMTYYAGSNEVDFAGATNVNSNLFVETAQVKLAGSGGLQGHVITGGDNVTITGAAEAISRVIYAPNADVELAGTGSVRGSVVSNTFRAVGAATVTFEEDHTSDLPDIQLDEGETVILSWN